MPVLLCIVCLIEGGWDPEREEEQLNVLLTAEPAVTVRNGNALCRKHVYHPCTISGTAGDQ